MNLPRINLASSVSSLESPDALIIGVVDVDGPRIVSSLEPDLTAALASQISDMALPVGSDDIHVLPGTEELVAKKIVVVGLGAERPDVEELREAAGRGVRAAGKVSHIALAFPVDEPTAQALVEGALLGGYRVSAKKKPSDESVWATLSVVGPVDAGSVDRGRTIAQSVWFVRDLVNTPPNELYPESFSDRVSEALAGTPVAIEVYDETRLAAEGFGGLMGVGGGSAKPPRLVALRYQPEDAIGHIALVGKGITFDSGGLSLKPAQSMIGMKYDMTGAATVAGTLVAVAQLGAPVAVTGWLCLAENMPSGTAQRPGDVITIRGGTTVEVLNTDAEGRLVLADGLQAASEEHPDLIVDIATLTGAARIALGERYAGLMGDEAARAVVDDAAERAGELVWQMPLPEELRSGLNSDVADIANIASGSSLGGMLVAGLFLREFVGSSGAEGESRRIPWAHLDIAGPASNSSSSYGYTPKGPTGALTRTLTELLVGLQPEALAELRQ